MTRISSISFALILLLFTFTGCQSESDTAATEADEAAETAEADEMQNVEWGYSGEGAPENWADISEDFAACDGQMQSPIDIPTGDNPEETSSISMSYETAEGTLKDAGYVLQMDISGGTLTIDDKAYQLAQLHFHTPSEHTIDGTRYPAEVHLVHAADDAQLAVVGVMFEEGEENAALAEFWNNIPNIEEAGTVNFNAGSLLPDDRTAYTYSGSLTTPPCSEVVSWHVMETPVSISAEQLETLTNMHDDNERPIQPLNDRTVEVAEL